MAASLRTARGARPRRGGRSRRAGRARRQPEGDLGIPGREAFRWPTGAERHHLYVVVEGSPPHVDHVRFRDRLRSDPELARAYGALKRELAERHRADRSAYIEAKSGFVTGVLRG